MPWVKAYPGLSGVSGEGPPATEERIVVLDFSILQ